MMLYGDLHVSGQAWGRAHEPRTYLVRDSLLLPGLSASLVWSATLTTPLGGTGVPRFALCLLFIPGTLATACQPAL